MKSLQRFCLLLLCLVLLLGVSSVTAKAVEIEIPDYYYYSVVDFETAQRKIPAWKQQIFKHGDGKTDEVYGTSFLDTANGEDVVIRNATYIKNTNNTHFLSAGQSAWVTISSVSQTAWLYSDWDDREYDPHSVSAFVLYTDGTAKYVNAEVISKDTWFDVKFFIQAEKDVATMCFTTIWAFPWIYDFCYAPEGETVNLDFYFGENDDTDNTLRIDVQDPNTGLLEDMNERLDEMLGSLFNGFQDLGNKTEEGFKSMGNKLTEVWNAITNLPSKIWEFFENGITKLFVPDDEFMIGYKDKWSALLSDKLGAVYQVTDIIFGAWDDVQNADETNTITFPTVSIPLPDNNNFSFGGYDVKIVPDGFETFVEVVKGAIGIACTFLFINGVRKRYDEVMGVSE